MLVKIYELTDEVLEYYRNNVSGNEKISYDQAKRKITRNIALASRLPSKKRLDRLLGIKHFQYGNLYIKTKRNKVVDIKNNKGQRYVDWVKDGKLYTQLTIQLGILD